jgi:hypothetical protein
MIDGVITYRFHQPVCVYTLLSCLFIIFFIFGVMLLAPFACINFDTIIYIYLFVDYFRLLCCHHVAESEW